MQPRTSHYGPRQGIYQPMESFSSLRWRVSSLRYPDYEGRIAMPPNSFPARSLIKRPIYKYVYPPVKPPPNPLKSPPVPPTSPPINPKKDDPDAVSQPSPSSATSRPSRPSSTSNTRKPTENSSMTSTPVVMKPHPPHKSTLVSSRQRYIKSSHYSYPDPTKVMDAPSFHERLSDLAQLERETVIHESQGRWAYYTPNTRPSSATASRTQLHGAPNTRPSSATPSRTQLSGSDETRASIARKHSCVKSRPGSSGSSRGNKHSCTDKPALSGPGHRTRPSSAGLLRSSKSLVVVRKHSCVERPKSSGARSRTKPSSASLRGSAVTRSSTRQRSRISTVSEESIPPQHDQSKHAPPSFTKSKPHHHSGSGAVQKSSQGGVSSESSIEPSNSKSSLDLSGGNSIPLLVEERTSDLGLSIDSLSLSDDGGSGISSVSTLHHHPVSISGGGGSDGEGGGGEDDDGEGKVIVSTSLSSFILRSHRRSSKRKTHKSTKKVK